MTPNTDIYWKSLRRFLSPIASLLDDSTVSEIMINGRKTFVERGGCLYETDVSLDDASLLAAARNLAQFTGKEIQEDTTHLAARFPDGSRVQVVLPPCSRSGILVAIRKFGRQVLTLEDLIRLDTLSPQAAEWLKTLVHAKKNILVSGGTGSGKTSLLNVLAGMTPPGERILVMEDTQELQISHDHMVSMETRPPRGKPPRGEVTMRDMVKIALRMRPDRIIIGEVRGGEALDLTQAMATGHSGSMSTIHANDPVGALRRLETLATFGAHGEIPLHAIRSQVAGSVEAIVQISRFRDGSRRVTHISEVLALDLNGEYRVQDVYAFRTHGKDARGRVAGVLAYTGKASSFLGHLQAFGFDIPEEMLSQ